MTNETWEDYLDRRDAHTDYDYDEPKTLEEDGEELKCGACGKPATWIDSNEPVCGKHTVKDVYGV